MKINGITVCCAFRKYFFEVLKRLFACAQLQVECTLYTCKTYTKYLLFFFYAYRSIRILIFRFEIWVRLLKQNLFSSSSSSSMFARFESPNKSTIEDFGKWKKKSFHVFLVIISVCRLFNIHAQCLVEF